MTILAAVHRQRSADFAARERSAPTLSNREDDLGNYSPGLTLEQEP